MRNNTFITFIGYNKDNKNDNLKPYRTASYEFPDQTQSIETPLVGLALSKWLDDKLKKSSSQEHLNKIIYLGTSSSSWECLIELAKGNVNFKDGFSIDENSQIYQYMLEIISDNNKTPTIFTEEQIKELQDEINKNLRLKNENYVVELKIYPDVKESSQVTNLFSVIKNTICDESEQNENSLEIQSIYLDITHGFRYIPMFALTTLMFLRLLNKIKLAGMYYADLSNHKILDLVDIFKLFESSIALSKYDASLDLGNFYELFSMFAKEENEDLVDNKNISSSLKALKEFSFNERIIQLKGARNKSTNIQSLKFSSPVFKEIEQIYQDKIKWTKEAHPSKRLSSLAISYF